MTTMNSTLKRTLLSALVVPFALGAQSASAAPITDWGYNVINTFSNFTASSGDGEVTASDSGHTLSWGTRENQSSISITDADAESGLITNGSSVMGGIFTHSNFVIDDADAALRSFDLQSVLRLTPFAPNSGPTLPPESITFASFFSETTNVSNADCGFTSTSDCDDIFTVGNPGDLTDGLEFASSFVVDDFSYTVFLDLIGLAVLEDNACAAAGASAGCVGLLTEEDEVNTFNARFRIAATQISVPEPATLALLGMGIAGLSLSRRKKAAKS